MTIDKVLNLTLLAVLLHTVAADLPRTLKSCPRSSDFEGCLRELLQDIKPYLAQGNFGPGLVTPQMEPIYEPLLAITGPELNINMTNLYTKGATTYKVTSIKPDFQKLQIDIGLLTPMLSYTSQYSLSQKFSGINIAVKGTGDIEGLFSKYRLRALRHSSLVLFFRKSYK